jgi:hypothetical protein
MPLLFYYNKRLSKNNFVEKIDVLILTGDRTFGKMFILTKEYSVHLNEDSDQSNYDNAHRYYVHPRWLKHGHT